MKLELVRDQLDPDVTIGRLSVDGAFFCYTLEDVVRPDGEKVYGETAIPAGTYKVVITHSPRFKVRMPLLLNVAGFMGVRIHAGNTAGDTEGCVLVGDERRAKSIGRSRVAYDRLFAVLDAALKRGETVDLTIR